MLSPTTSYQQGIARNASESARPQDWKGLVACYAPALGNTGTTIRSLSGRGHHGTPTGHDWILAPNIGRVVSLADTSDDVSFPDAAVPDFVSNQLPFTVVLYWARLGTENNGRVVHRTENAGSNIAWQIVFDPSSNTNKVVFTTIRNGAQSSKPRSDSQLTLGQYYVVVGRVSAWSGDSPTISIHIDGVLQIGTDSSSFGAGDDNTFLWGKRRGASDSPHTGNFALMSIYDYALTNRHIWEISKDPLGLYRRRKQPEVGRVAAAALTVAEMVAAMEQATLRPRRPRRVMVGF